MCLEKSSSWAWSAAASATASLKWASLWARNGRHPVVQALLSSQRSVTARAAHSAEDWRRHALFMARPSKVPSMTERASVALACVWMQLLKLRKTATSQGCKYDVLRGGMASLAWMLAMSQKRIHDCPSPSWIEHAVQCGCELQERRRRGPAVLRCDVVGALRPGLLRQDGVCLARVHDLHEHVQRSTAMLKATVNVVASLVLPCSWACFTPRRPHPM